MKLVLKETINEKKRWVEGAPFDWPSSTVRQISATLGRNDWYDNQDRVTQRNNTQGMKKSPGRPKKELQVA